MLDARSSFRRDLTFAGLIVNVLGPVRRIRLARGRSDESDIDDKGDENGEYIRSRLGVSSSGGSDRREERGEFGGKKSCGAGASTGCAVLELMEGIGPDGSLGPGFLEAD